jgi:DNA (cytosine-5)-methyltransferase 1
LEIARPLLTTMHKMHRSSVDKYVTTEGRLSKLTPRECLRLMSFCASFKIIVSDTSMYQQAVNSIVVDVLMVIMNEILKCYDFE